MLYEPANHLDAESYTAAKQLRDTGISAKANAHEAAKAEVKKLERRLYQAREARASAERSQKVSSNDSLETFKRYL